MSVGCHKNKNDNERPRGGAIVVIAKCPIPGKCKTRLAACLGDEKAALLARAMLSDVLVTLTKSVRTYIRSSPWSICRTRPFPDTSPFVLSI